MLKQTKRFHLFDTPIEYTWTIQLNNIIHQRGMSIFKRDMEYMFKLELKMDSVLEGIRNYCIQMTGSDKRLREFVHLTWGIDCNSGLYNEWSNDAFDFVTYGME